MEESIRLTDVRDEWKKYVRIVCPTLGSRTAKEQNRTEQIRSQQNTDLGTELKRFVSRPRTRSKNSDLEVSLVLLISLFLGEDGLR